MAVDTKHNLLSVARELVRHQGYNAFSYKDLASKVGIKSASIHYHYPRKADLAAALITEYLIELESTLIEIQQQNISNHSKIVRFIQSYEKAEQDNSLCLCGSMASDLNTLDMPVKEAIKAYIQRSVDWITATLKVGVAEGEFSNSFHLQEVASTLIASLQGALLVSRAMQSNSVVPQVSRTFFSIIAK